jgi:precorrin-8X/cobalt-precorrin-8 methylmutase
MTRGAAAMRLAAPGLDGAIVAIGNSPTALFELLRLAAEEGVRPALVVGVPVGFVGAAESKEALATSGLPHITLPGNRGGSTIAAAVVNALIRLFLTAEVAESGPEGPPC